MGGTGRVRLGAQQAPSLPCPSGSPRIRCMFNYASLPVLIRDLQTALKISSFRAYFVLVKFLSQLKEEDNGVKPYVEAREQEDGEELRSRCLSAHPGHGWVAKP